MPLPAALQARLKKRGLVIKEAENIEELETETKKKKFKDQPLPPGWFKVPDPGSGHVYFWNVHTNQVAWRHPNDPRAEITYPASWKQKNESKETKSSNDDKNKEDKSKLKVKTGKHPSLLKAQRQKEKNIPYRKGKKGFAVSSFGMSVNLDGHEKQTRTKANEDTLDPMDPASYSDVGRGSWSTGLKEDSEVKTGVDTTASGPLFQQRPYPSPGDILRRNRKGQTEVEDE